MRRNAMNLFKGIALFMLVGTSAIFDQALGQNLYSRGSGAWGSITWSTTSHTAGNCGCTPGDLTHTTYTAVIGNGNAVTLNSTLITTTVGGIIVNDDGNGGTFTFGNAAVTTVLTVNGDVTINSGGTGGIFQSGATGATSHTLNITGNLTNNATFDLTANAATAQTASFNGSATQTLSGTGSTFTFRNLTLNTSSAADIAVNSGIKITGILNFNADGLLILASTVNLTLANTATITNNNSSRYIQVDGTSATNSQLIRMNSGATGDWKFLFPIGTSAGGYSPVDLSSATVTTAPTASSTLGVKAIYNASVIGQLRRTFRFTIVGNAAATTIANGKFTYANPSTPDISQGDVLANYSTIWFLNLSTATWATLAGTAPGATFFTPSASTTMTTGTYYYTIGNSTAYPSAWYSYQTGNWSDPDIWTLDPSGTTLNNPLTQVPNAGDQVVILNGFTVTADINNITVSTTTIQGGATLDMGATTGQNLGAVSGAGLLRVNGVGLPTGTYTSFVAAGTGGTIEYYNASGTLPVGQTTYNNLLLSNSTGSAVTFVTTNNFTVNNNFNVTQTSGGGTVTWQINDATAANRTMTITGDLTVSASGKITAGTGNSGSATQHSLTINGNFTNNGIVRFLDPTDASYSNANYTSGAVFTTAWRGNAVNVTFSGLTNKTVTCNAQTDFYRLIVSKGTGQQAILTVNSSAVANFRLFGPNNHADTGAAPNFVCNNSLSIQNGTLLLTGSITIPSLAEQVSGDTNGYPIPQKGALWLNGVNVSVTVSALTGSTTTDNGRRVLLSGLLRITNGSFTTGVGTTTLGWSKGISAEDDGQMVIEGGTVTCSQLRTRVTGVNNFAYSQSGGTVNVGNINGIDSNFARFDLAFTTCTFIMTGGILNVSNPTSLGTVTGFEVLSAASSYQVTNGTINMTVTTNAGASSPAANFSISSTAPLYNVNINRTSAAGVTTAQLAASLTVLNAINVVSANGPTLDCNGNNLTVGGDFNVQSGTTFKPGPILTFNGGGAQTWTDGGTINALSSVVMNKSAGTLLLAGTGGFPSAGSITGLTLTSGTLDDGGKTLTVTTTLSNSATHIGTGSIVHNAAGASTIGGNKGTFGNLTVQTNATITISGIQTVSGTLRLTGASTTLFVGSNSFSALGNIYSDAGTGVAFSNTKRIETNGLRNDGGLTRQATSAVDLLFPVGTSTVLYTPITINTTATTAGTITVQPVNGAHPNVTTTSVSLNYFWRVVSSGFAGITAVSHKTYTFSTATLNPNTTIYTPARFDPTALTWAYRTATYNATATTVIPNFNTGAAWTGLAADKLDGEYTAGDISAFGAVTVYYSRATGNWSAPATWSTASVGGAAASTIPCSTCPVVIGDSSHPHNITTDVNGQTCGSIYIDATSILDCSTSTGINVGINTTGTGKLRIASANFPAGDFINFLGANGGTVEWYGTTYSIPKTGPAPQNMNLFNYYNLTVSPNTGAVITLPTTALTIYNNFTVSGTGTGQVNTDATGARSLTVTNAFNVASGTLSLRNGSAATFTVSGATTISSGAVMGLQGGGTQTHSFSTSGGITNNGTMTFKSGIEVVNVTVTGTSNTTLTGTNPAGVTTLNVLTINKGTSQTPVFTFGPLSGTVTTLNNNWLTLQNGTINFNMSGTTFSLTNAATTPYSIPATAQLEVQAGTVNISNVAANDSDLLLSGTLQVAGGTVNVGPLSTANDNDLEYSSAGTPTIIVSSGTLYVNGSIRRPVTTISGALVYNQSGGTVTAGGQNSDNSRGVFEIESNTGSSFTLTGTGTLAVTRSTGGTTYADLYLNPVTSSVASTSTIQIGANALGAKTLSVNIAPAIGKFTVMGAASNAQTVNMNSSILTTSGTLTINTASLLNTNSLNVNIGGDLTIVGTYNGSANTTTFNGSGAQAGTLTAGSSFNNITINKSAGTATLSGTTTITNLNILSGTLSVSGTLNVTGDITNNSTQTGVGVIAYNGTPTTHNLTSNNGSFTNLSIIGAGASNTITVTGNTTINGVLLFSGTSRFLSIGSYLLTFGSSASISGQGSSDFIRTNGVSSDLGVVRNWPVGTTSFTYAVGTLSNYTPLALTLTVSALGAGNLTVVPVNQRHPTYNVASTEQILNYYWIVTRDNALAYSATGSQTYQFPSTLMGGAGGTLAAAYLNLLGSPLGWNTTDPSGAATTSSMTFTNSLNTNMPTSGNTFHYSVGTSNTLPNPILPVYSRLSDPSVSGSGGNWNNPSSWTTSSTGIGAALSSAPTGVPVVILSGATILMNVNARTAFNSTLNGTLVLNTSFGHNLGTISGTGTMKTQTNTFPAGTYTSFVSSAGGTIEYVGPMTMNSRSTYNNLKFSGTGTVTMTNTDLTLNGGLNIAVATVTLDNTANNRNITLAGDWSNSGTFNSGTGAVTFNGTAAQQISGSTTFTDVTVSKTNTLTLNAANTINGVLTLTSGDVVSNAYPAASFLSLGSSASISGGGSGSFIDGQISVSVASGSTVTFPLGSVSAARYRPATIGNTGGPSSDVWTASYIGNNPTTNGYSFQSFNAANMAKVSQYEFWQIACASGTSTASLTLSFGPGSYGGSDIGILADLKTARWNGTQWDLPPGGGTFSQSGTAVAGTVTVSFQNAFSPQTIATDDINSTLPLTWLSFTGTRLATSVSLTWKTAQEIDNDHFDVQRSEDATKFVTIGSVAGSGTSLTAHTYHYVDGEVPATIKYYYRIRQIDYNGNSSYGQVIVMEGSGQVTQRWTAFPNPVNGQQHFQVKLIDTSADSASNVQIMLLSIDGRMLFKAEGDLDQLNTRLDSEINGLASGLFLLRVWDGEVQEVFRIVRY
jgi:fibronectin-binding autotransporter adhesin